MKSDTSAPPTASHEACPLCGVAIAVGVERCTACGYHLAGIGDRPGIFSRPALLWTLAGLCAVYIVTLLVVLAAR